MITSFASLSKILGGATGTRLTFGEPSTTSFKTSFEE